MKYRDLYSKDFLRQFKDYELAVGDIELEDDKFSIDVLKIVEVCDIPVEYDIVIHSGWSYFDRNSERKIVVNFSEPEYRQRFTLAHELGHIILEHSGMKFRTADPSKYADEITRVQERLANKFAAELLMPKKLVILAVRKSATKLGYILDDKFTPWQVDEIIKATAYEMNISFQTLKIRLEQLQVFVDA